MSEPESDFSSNSASNGDSSLETKKSDETSNHIHHKSTRNEYCSICKKNHKIVSISFRGTLFPSSSK
jgi:hypothetical protein